MIHEHKITVKFSEGIISAEKVHDQNEIIEELQRDILVRDETIKELNLKIVDLQAEIKEAENIAEKSGNAKRDYKITHMEDELRHAKNELVLNSQQIQKFMEEGTKTVDEYIAKYDKAEETIGKLKDELVIKDNLFKNKDEVYRRVIDDLQEARKNISTLQVEKLSLDNKNNSLNSTIAQLNNEINILEERLIEASSTASKIKKQNLLVEEFNSKYYGISISELGVEINKAMYEMMLQLRKDHLYAVIQNGKDLRYLLEEEGRKDLIEKLKGFHDLKDFKPIEVEKDEDSESEEEVKNENKNIKKNSGTKIIRKGGGYEIQKDEDMEKEDKKVKKTKAEMSEKEWKEKVWKAKLNNPVLKKFMTLSKHKEKGKNGEWKNKISLADLLTKGMKSAKKPNSIFGKVFKVFKSKPTDKSLIKKNEKLTKRMEMYSKLLTDSVSGIIGYVSSAKDGIEQIENNYKGFFSLRDKKLMKKIIEKEDSEDDNPDPTSKLAQKEREVNELTNELNHLKIQLSDIEDDFDKASQKERMFKTKLEQSEQDADEIKRNFENRMAEFKTALYEKDEETTKLREIIKNLGRDIRIIETK